MNHPKPPSVIWLLLLCAWPFGGALYAHRRMERYREELDEWVAFRTERARLAAEREVAAKVHAIERIFDEAMK